MIRPYHLQIYNVSCTCFYALNNQYSWVVYMYLFLTFNSLQRNQQLFVKKKKKWKFCPQFIFHHLLSLPRYHNLNYIVIGLTMYRNFISYSLWTHNKQIFGVNLQHCEIFNMFMYDREKQPCKLYAECTSYMYVLFQQCTAVVYILSDYLVSWLQAIVSSFI